MSAWLIVLIVALTAPLWMGVLWLFWTWLEDIAGPPDGYDGKGRIISFGPDGEENP